MGFNHGFERKMFNREQRHFMEKCLKAGMSEADIHAMCEYDLGVFRLLYLSGADAAAIPDVIVQAGLPVLWKTFGRAAFQSKNLIQQVDRHIDRACVTVRAKIARAVFFNQARLKHSRIVFLRGDLNIRVGFIIAQQDIVLRRVFFNQIAL